MKTAAESAASTLTTDNAAAEAEMHLVANGCLLLVGLAGAALLVWWALDFHPSGKQMWMVPAGLVMTGTSVVVWFSVAASGGCWRLGLLPRPSTDNPSVELDKY